MATRRITVKTVARPCSSGHVHVRTTVSNGSTTRTTSKTIRVK